MSASIGPTAMREMSQGRGNRRMLSFGVHAAAAAADDGRLRRGLVPHLLWRQAGARKSRRRDAIEGRRSRRKTSTLKTRRVDHDVDGAHERRQRGDGRRATAGWMQATASTAISAATRASHRTTTRACCRTRSESSCRRRASTRTRGRKRRRSRRSPRGSRRRARWGEAACTLPGELQREMLRVTSAVSVYGGLACPLGDAGWVYGDGGAAQVTGAVNAIAFTVDGVDASIAEEDLSLLSPDAVGQEDAGNGRSSIAASVNGSDGGIPIDARSWGGLGPMARLGLPGAITTVGPRLRGRRITVLRGVRVDSLFVEMGLLHRWVGKRRVRRGGEKRRIGVSRCRRLGAH